MSELVEQGDGEKYLPCRFENCGADAETFTDHPDHGEIAVCATCARLFETNE